MSHLPLYDFQFGENSVNILAFELDRLVGQIVVNIRKFVTERV